MLKPEFYHWTKSGLECEEVGQDCLLCSMRSYYFSAIKADIEKGFRPCKQPQANEQLKQKGIRKPTNSTIKASSPKPCFKYICKGCHKTISIKRDHGGRVCRHCAHSVEAEYRDADWRQKVKGGSY